MAQSDRVHRSAPRPGPDRHRCAADVDDPFDDADVDVDVVVADVSMSLTPPTSPAHCQFAVRPQAHRPPIAGTTRMPLFHHQTPETTANPLLEFGEDLLGGGT